ncbi:ABC-ATPase domain-containing protein [Fervidibacillus halotolerans]|uniref:ABC-ATPase domain-containing protein n=1 Tax=Fervidibacillus halotolerans TaxID=2980027 RepID=A0A9E8M0F0_9BACI|nr:ABC-ATPase domain-containing protein [Fervidibacillus halotolerans]WAA12712.1 ABC-ATPase domain-containing protein [Fervidibacillus halotolerans]
MDRLKRKLKAIDGKGYKAYKEIQGTYKGNGFRLHIDYVQGDPFASPSRIRFVVQPLKKPLKNEWLDKRWRKIALEDFLARKLGEAIRNRQTSMRGRMGTGKSGLIAIDEPGQEMMMRTAVIAKRNEVEVRLSIGLPAAGRRILGKHAEMILCEEVPEILLKVIHQIQWKKLEEHIVTADRQQAIRGYLKREKCIAFVANGSILPRESGVSNRPLHRNKAVPFQSPPSLERSISLPDGTTISGMVIPEGVTLIVGGGYHGKSTLLKAIERGIYNHLPGDGREYVITEETACKIRAEDGRRVEKVNISPFISHLPFGKDTNRFSTDGASGSTSEAANIVEALEIGSRCLLIDEDTSATNFLVRDARMQQLVHKDKEPITPFIDRVRDLYEIHGVSSIIVLGGSGDYFDVADRVIMMDEYQPKDVTEEAHKIAKELNNRRQKEGKGEFSSSITRYPLPTSYESAIRGKEKLSVKGRSTILIGRSEIDLSAVEQLTDPSQTRAIAEMIRQLFRNYFHNSFSLKDGIDRLYERIEREGLDIISPYRGQHPGDFALPRKYELAAAINRLRTLQVK